MRTIKFRGKRVDSGEWIYGDLSTFGGTDCEISDWNTVDYSRYDVDPETVGQLTGLFDKNGKEIYEGDVVQTTTRIGIVEIKNCSLSVNDHNPETKNDCSYPHKSWVVLGNIHDNPELLKNE